MKKAIITLTLTLAMFFIFTACGHEHVFGEWTTVTEETCTSEGLNERVCECGEKETQVIPMAEHDYKEKVIDKVTCTKDGKIKKTCKNCDKKLTEVVTAEGHDFAEATIYTPQICTKCNKTKGKALSEAVKVGSKVESENHSFVVEKGFFTGALSEKRGYTTYNHSSGYFYAIKLKFKNLSSEAFDRWNSERVTDVNMEYQGKYNYEGDYWCPVDDIVPLSEDSLYIVYTVPPSMAKDNKSAIYTTFTIDGVVYSMIVQKGKTVSADKTDDDNSADVNTKKNLKLNDKRTDGENFKFTLKELKFTPKLSEKRGNTTYSYYDEGFYLALKLEFTNLASKNFEEFNSDRITDMKLVFDSEYEYEGSVWTPGDDIVPLDTDSVYIVYKIPETIKGSDAPLTATFTIDGAEFEVDCNKAK